MIYLLFVWIKICLIFTTKMVYFVKKQLGSLEKVSMKSFSSTEMQCVHSFGHSCIQNH